MRVFPARTTFVKLGDPYDARAVVEPGNEATSRPMGRIYLEAMIELGLGNFTQRTLIVEGMEEPIPRDLENAAARCMVIIAGGKRLLVQTDETRADGPLLARVFLDEKVYGEPLGYVHPYGYQYKRLELGTFWQWITSRGYRDADVKDVLNGPRPAGREVEVRRPSRV